jgi:hypothetical protein
MSIVLTDLPSKTNRVFLAPFPPVWSLGLAP